MERFLITTHTKDVIDLFNKNCRIRKNSKLNMKTSIINFTPTNNINLSLFDYLQLLNKKGNAILKYIPLTWSTIKEEKIKNLPLSKIMTQTHLSGIVIVQEQLGINQEIDNWNLNFEHGINLDEYLKNLILSGFKVIECIPTCRIKSKKSPTYNEIISAIIITEKTTNK